MTYRDNVSERYCARRAIMRHREAIYAANVDKSRVYLAWALLGTAVGLFAAASLAVGLI